MIKSRRIPGREKRKSLFYNFEVLDESDKILGYLADINLSGLKVKSKESIQINSTHIIKIKIPPQISEKKYISFEAECVWCKKDANYYQIGFKANHKNGENRETIKIIMELLASPDDPIL